MKLHANPYTLGNHGALHDYFIYSQNLHTENWTEFNLQAVSQKSTQSLGAVK